MDISDLEKRITVLEDIEAIKKLKARYCAICDEDHNPAKSRHCWPPTESGRRRVGRHQGHDAIRKLFQSFQERISFSQHNVMNPIIDVSGNRATGIWYFMGRSQCAMEIVRCGSARARKTTTSS